MKVITSASDMLALSSQWNNQAVGFVPTMGALHEGHAHLLKTAKETCDLVVLSIFVNPTQFNDSSDFQKYPKNLESDIALAQKSGVDIVFAPQAQEIYPDGYNFSVKEKSLSSQFCGAYRPGHFEGMLTVVLKLLMIVKPHKAFFGEKDFQQLQLVKGLVESFFVPVEIISVPTVRDEAGLALSSRNQRLTKEGLQKAKQFNHILKGRETEDIKLKLAQAGFEVEYVEKYQDRILAAVWLEQVRLIDNVRA